MEKKYKANLYCNGKIESVNITKDTPKYWYIGRRVFRKDDGMEVSHGLRWKFKGILKEVSLR